MEIEKLVFWLHRTVLGVVYVEDGLLGRGNVLSDCLGIVDLEAL